MTTRTHWLNRAPAMLREEGWCSDGEPDATTVDRRWLWRLENFLSVSGTTDYHHDMAADLREYLNESCEHHWHAYAGDSDIPTHRQCLYCHDIEWRGTDPEVPHGS